MVAGNRRAADLQTLRPRLALTPGEPAGIGPDLAVGLAAQAQDCDLVIVADPDLLAARAARLGMAFSAPALALEDCTERRPVVVDPIATEAPAIPGRTDPANAAYVLATLRRAVALCQAGLCDGLVTGPVHKAVINEAGIAFTGHTDFLAELTCAPHVVMMLATDTLRVALATVHLPLAAVPAAISRPDLTATITVLERDLRARFGIEQPCILVAGLNPHAGEDGYLGREEIDIIAPTLSALRERGLDVVGPLPADTLFTPERLRGADAVLAMYHDQGLPVIKHLGFGRTVNITLGLPIIRTSVDHGTALDRAGTGDVDDGSLRAALALAARLARNACYA